MTKAGIVKNVSNIFNVSQIKSDRFICDCLDDFAWVTGGDCKLCGLLISELI